MFTFTHQISTTGSRSKPSTFHLQDNSLILKFLPNFEPHQKEHLYLWPDITAPSLLRGQMNRGRGWPTAWTLSHCEHYRWHSKFSNIISVLDGLYWSACYSKCLAASPCRAFSFYLEEQKSGPWKDVGRVSKGPLPPCDKTKVSVRRGVTGCKQKVLPKMYLWGWT